MAAFENYRFSSIHPLHVLSDFKPFIAVDENGKFGCVVVSLSKAACMLREEIGSVYDVISTLST